MKKVYFFIISIILHTSLLHGVELITPQMIAQRYIDADLIVIGKVVSMNMETVYEKKIVQDDGWTRVDKMLIEVYTVKPDSVIKGGSKDSMLVIQSNPFADQEHKEKFEKVNDQGDSVFTAVNQTFDDYRGGADIIRGTGDYIVFIVRDHNKYITTLNMAITESNLQLLQKIRENGMKAVCPEPPDQP